MASITRTIREQITNQIRDELVAGNLPAGRPLREGELAERFGVSRGPIRDAFLQLSQEGFLAYQANRGVTVRNPPDPAHRELIVSLREQIECFVVTHGLDQLRENGLGVVKSSLSELEAACAGGDIAAVARCDMAFHAAILEGAGGDGLLPVWKWLCSQMLLTYSRLENYEQVYQEHVDIFHALESGGRQEALAAIQANIR